MTKDEALKLALEALELHGKQYPHMVKGYCLDAITAIKEALAQPEQEPVAFASHGVVNWIADKQFRHESLLYSAPQRTWVGLTDIDYAGLPLEQVGLVRWAEAKLKEKNS